MTADRRRRRPTEGGSNPIRPRGAFARAILCALVATLAVMLPGGEAMAWLTQRVVFIIIDGPRDQEFLEHPTHANIPHIWNELRPQAYVSHAFYNLGVTQTESGHATIFTGTPQVLPNDGTVRPTLPTLWEYYREATRAGDASCFYATYKGKLRSLSYSTYPNYGPPDSARVAGPTYADNNTVAAWLQDAVLRQPTVSAMFLGQTDTMAHQGNWTAYIDAIRGADSLAAYVWNWIEATPPWAGHTTLFITSDHGRHTTDWMNHGDSCAGCRHIPLIALGPDFVAGVEASAPAADQRDLCRTAAALLGIPVPLAQGRTLLELFADPTGIPPQAGRSMPLRLEVSPQPTTGPVLARLSGEVTGNWAAALYDPAGRRLWSGSWTGDELARGVSVAPPPGAGSTVTWLQVTRPDGARTASRIVWVR